MALTIVVPLDGSALAERALPVAVGLARGCGGRVILLHAKLVMRPESDPQPDLEAVARRIRADGVPAEALTVSIFGDEAARIIREVASEQQANLIVMSTHGRGGLGRLLCGSVADQVLREADRPLLLIPPHCAQLWPTPDTAGGTPASTPGVTVAAG
jgi:nucleotide-binding universal stress UspA family protein